MKTALATARHPDAPASLALRYTASQQQVPLDMQSSFKSQLPVDFFRLSWCSYSCCFINRRQTLIALKEKTTKSRSPSINNSPISIKSNKKIIPESVSDEDLHEEIKEEKPAIIRTSVERLDTQVSTLHQDVATLSIEVRNAIQALQEMTYSTFTHMDHHVPARSIPNLQNGVSNVHIAQEFLTRSSSQPAEIWHRSNPNIKSVPDFLW